jgi:hypothetical protein
MRTHCVRLLAVLPVALLGGCLDESEPYTPPPAPAPVVDEFTLPYSTSWSVAAAPPGDINLPGVGPNAPGYEGCPIESADGLSLFIAARRAGGGDDLEPEGDLDVWVSDRAQVGDPWPTPRNLGKPINSGTAQDFCPTPVRGRSLLFVSTRGTCGGGDIFVTRQSPAGGWSEPEMLACAPNGPNSPGPERSPSLVETAAGTYLVYSSNGGSGNEHIYSSQLGSSGAFGPGSPIAGLNSDYVELMPNVRLRPEGWLEIVFSSNRPTWGPNNMPAVGIGQNQDVYISRARTFSGPWSPPTNLGSNINSSTADEQRATLSADGKRLYFGAGGDIFVSERSGS